MTDDQAREALLELAQELDRMRAFVDAMRAAFGADAIDASIRAGMRARRRSGRPRPGAPWARPARCRPMPACTCSATRSSTT